MSPVAFVFIGIAVLAIIMAWKGTYKSFWQSLTGIIPSATKPTIGASGNFGSNTKAAQEPSNAFPGSAPAGQNQQPTDFQSMAMADAARFGINPTYFVNQIQAESGFNPNAVSPAGAEGIAQFMPATAEGLGVNPFDPTASLSSAAQLMSQYIHRFGSEDQALAAYNAGSGALADALAQAAHNGGTWSDYIPAETRNYIHEITGDL